MVGVWGERAAAASVRSILTARGAPRAGATARSGGRGGARHGADGRGGCGGAAAGAAGRGRGGAGALSRGSEEVRPIRSAATSVARWRRCGPARAPAALERLGDTDTPRKGARAPLDRSALPTAGGGRVLEAPPRCEDRARRRPGQRRAPLRSARSPRRAHQSRAGQCAVPRLVAHLLRHFKGTVRGARAAGQPSSATPSAMRAPMLRRRSLRAAPRGRRGRARSALAAAHRAMPTLIRPFRPPPVTA